MKMKRFFAPDIRQAMRMVKDEFGSDAVIMSNKSVDGGVEIVAAMDFDEQLVKNNIKKQEDKEDTVMFSTQARQAAKIDFPDFEAEKNRLHIVSSDRKQSIDGSPARRNIDQYIGYAEKAHIKGKPVKEDPPLKSVEQYNLNHYTKPAAPKQQQASRSDDLLLEMSKELKSLRAEMNSKLSNISLASSLPVKTDLLQRLAGMGISKKLSVKIAARFANVEDKESSFTQAKDLLSRVTPIANDDFLENGGIVSLVGPTGVGKTTTIAKLAAKFILQHGSKQVALITTDNYRIGAHEQLNTYGRILDVPVRVASSASELHSLINFFSDKKLILIDTAGMSQREMKLIEQINTLQQSGQSIKSYLVMSASTEYKAMNETIKAFNIFEPHACILTKLDEAATIGSAISSLIEHNLPIAFITNGQQVPEDMHNPCAKDLIEQCASELDNDQEEWVAYG